MGTGTGSIGHVGVEGEVAIVGGVPVPRTEVSEEEAGLRRPSGVVHDHLRFGWNHQSISIDRLKEDFQTRWIRPGSRARSRWRP